jgi:hypothetical protein
VAQQRGGCKLTWSAGAGVGVGRMRARLDEAKECDTVGVVEGGSAAGEGDGVQCLGARELIGKEALGRRGVVWCGPQRGNGPERRRRE